MLIFAVQTPRSTSHWASLPELGSFRFLLERTMHLGNIKSPSNRPLLIRGIVVVMALCLTAATLSGRLPTPLPWGSAGVLILFAVGISGMALVRRRINDLRRRRETLERRNRELLALHQAALGVTSELGLDAVLQKILDNARRLLETRFAALSIYDENGEMTQFLTSGMDPRTVRRIGPPPTAKGLFKVVLEDGQSLRLDDILNDERVFGFPANHPHMQRLLAVPVITQSSFRGNLYVTDRLDGSTFSDEDEDILQRFGTQAGIAVDNAQVYARLEGLTLAEERLRLARELHDGQAQVLAFVSTKAQAVREYLNQGKVDDAKVQLDQLAQAAREVYADVREGILGLRTVVDKDRTFGDVLQRFIEQWQDQSGVRVDSRLDPIPDLPSDVELQLLRIVQEALANVRKHAAAQRVVLELKAADGSLHISLEDDGRGFDPEHFDRGRLPRFGLATMRERAEAIGGTFTINTQPGHGTRIDLVYHHGAAPASATDTQPLAGDTP